MTSSVSSKVSAQVRVSFLGFVYGIMTEENADFTMFPPEPLAGALLTPSMQEAYPQLTKRAVHHLVTRIWAR